MSQTIRQLFILMLAAMAMYAVNAQAQTLIPADRLEWTAPTTRADDSPLPAEEIAEYRVYCGATIEARQQIGIVNPPSVTIKLSALKWPSTNDGYYLCSVSTASIYGLESELSNSVFIFRKGGAFYKALPAKKLRVFVY